MSYDPFLDCSPGWRSTIHSAISRFPLDHLVVSYFAIVEYGRGPGISVGIGVLAGPRYSHSSRNFLFSLFLLSNMPCMRIPFGGSFLGEVGNDATWRAPWWKRHPGLQKALCTADMG